jgi:hypothetical protein
LLKKRNLPKQQIKQNQIFGEYEPRRTPLNGIIGLLTC